MGEEPSRHPPPVMPRWKARMRWRKKAKRRSSRIERAGVKNKTMTILVEPGGLAITLSTVWLVRLRKKGS